VLDSWVSVVEAGSIRIIHPFFFQGAHTAFGQVILRWFTHISHTDAAMVFQQQGGLVAGRVLPTLIRMMNAWLAVVEGHPQSGHREFLGEIAPQCPTAPGPGIGIQNHRQENETVPYAAVRHVGDPALIRSARMDTLHSIRIGPVRLAAIRRAAAYLPNLTLDTECLPNLPDDFGIDRLPCAFQLSGKPSIAQARLA
jgi:hypothetical protein